MRKGIKSTTTVLFMAFATVFLLAIACQPQVSQTELQEIVRAEVSSQISADARNGPRDFDALRAEFELAVMEPLNNLQGELEDLRDEFFGGDYASNLDVEGLRLELELVRSLFDTLEFEFARRDQLEQLRLEVEDIRFSTDPQSMELEIRSGFDEFGIELNNMRTEFESEGHAFNLELEQLRLEIEGVRRHAENVEEALRNEIDSLNRRMDSFR